MTDQKNNVSTNTNKKPADFSQDINQLPIHTMKQDLNDLLNPNRDKEKKILPPNIEKERQKNTSFRTTDSSLKKENSSNKTNPFLTPSPTASSAPLLAPNIRKVEKNPLPLTEAEKTNRELWEKTELVSKKTTGLQPINSLPPINKINLPKSPNTSSEIKPEIRAVAPKSQWSKMVYVSLFLFIILLFSFGGYYFWITKNNNGNFDLFNNASPDFSFSEGSPNYLNISKLTGPEIEARINKYAEKIIEKGSSVPIEFILTNSKNEPISWAEFSSLLGMNLPADITDTFSGNFSLLINNDSGQKATGLIIDLSNEEKLRTAILQEEKNLALNLSPIFLEIPETNESWSSRDFNSNFYKGIEIRFINIISPEKLSVDYAIYQQQLIIGTTKNTIRDMLDHSGLTDQTNTTDTN